MIIFVYLCTIGNEDSVRWYRPRTRTSTSKGNDRDYLAILITNTYISTEPQEKVKKFEKDRKRLKNIFCRTNVDVLLADDPSIQEIWKSRDWAFGEVQQKYKCVFIVFSGHGGEKVDDCGKKSYYFTTGVNRDRLDTDEFINEFKQQNNIPKIFLLDACRGAKSIKADGDNCLIAYPAKKGEAADLPSSWIPVLRKLLINARGHRSITDIVTDANQRAKSEDCNPVIEENSLLDRHILIDLG